MCSVSQINSPLPGETEHASNVTNPDNATPKLESNDSRDKKVPEDNREPSGNIFVYSWNQDACKIDKVEDLPKFSPSKLIGRTFLYEMNNREKFRVKVMKKLDTWDADNHQNIKLLVNIGDSGIEDIMSYVEVCDHIEAKIEAEEKGDISIFVFKKLLGHEGPLTSRSENYKDSLFNIHIQ